MRCSREGEPNALVIPAADLLLQHRRGDRGVGGETGECLDPIALHENAVGGPSCVLRPRRLHQARWNRDGSGEGLLFQRLRSASLPFHRRSSRCWSRTILRRSDPTPPRGHDLKPQVNGCATALSGPRVLPELLRRDRLDRYRWNRPPGLRLYLAEVENWAKSLYVRTSDDGSPLRNHLVRRRPGRDDPTPRSQLPPRADRPPPTPPPPSSSGRRPGRGRCAAAVRCRAASGLSRTPPKGPRRGRTRPRARRPRRSPPAATRRTPARPPRGRTQR